MSSKLKIGVFGGRRGKVMMRVLVKHPDAELVAVCDKYRPFLKDIAQLAEEQGRQVALYESFDEFIKHDMDAVVLANYANEHAPFAIRAMKAGKHVLSEVVACETMSQAVELIETVEQTGKVYAYAENYCYSKSTFEMWRRYRRGDIGEITYGEGEYVHDGMSIVPFVTYGDPNHWRYHVHPFFYCTHSLGPLMTITGLRPVSVSGATSRTVKEFYLKGLKSGKAAVELVTLENGALVKSIHGGLKREPWCPNYEVYGTKGCMETQRFKEGEINVYIEGDIVCKGNLETYEPEQYISNEIVSNFPSHGGSDFYPTHFFIEKILGRPDGQKYSIDVYQAVDMTIVGILAYRSELNGGAPVQIPNLRNAAERDAFRNDHACTNPAVAGDQLLPIQKDIDELPPVPAAAFEHIRKLFEEGKHYEKYVDFE
jgi:predicted dehydrogenase